MKRKPRRTPRELALALAREPSVLWPAQTQVALVAALANLLRERAKPWEAPRQRERYATG